MMINIIENNYEILKQEQHKAEGRWGTTGSKAKDKPEDKPRRPKHRLGTDSTRSVSDRRVNNLKASRALTCKPRPESGFDCLVCAIFARQRVQGTEPETSAWDRQFQVCFRSDRGEYL